MTACVTPKFPESFGFSQRMRECVALNANGNSIESQAKILKGDKWIPRYVLCKKNADVVAPIFTIYKSRSDRNQHKFKSSFALQYFVGIETGFELRKQRNTLAIISKEQVVVLSFALPDSLIQWSAWLQTHCGYSKSFCVQLQRAPKYSLAEPLLRKEVALFLHDSCMALVHGRPQIVLEYVDFADLTVLESRANTFSFRTPTCNANDECYSVSSARLSSFYALLEKARRNQDALNAYLSAQAGEGEWLPAMPIGRSLSMRSNPAASIHSPFSVLYSPQLAARDRMKSRSGNQMSNLAIDSSKSPLNRTHSLATYYNMSSPRTPRVRATSDAHNYINMDEDLPETNGNADDLRYSGRFAKHATSSRGSSIHSRNLVIDSGDSTGHYCNIDEIMVGRDPRDASSSGRCLSLPDYVNIDECMPSTSVGNRKHSEHVYSNIDSPKTPVLRVLSRLSSQRQHSLDEIAEQDAWRRSQRYKPKSENYLNANISRTIPKSSSATALGSMTQKMLFPHASFHYDGDCSSTPHFDVVVGEPVATTSGYIDPPEGMVKVTTFPSTSFMTVRSGVGAVLARRLHATVKGSFSKYDGERSKMLAQSLSQREVKSADPLEGIESAIKSGQERLKESDRRASAVSFRNLIAPQKRGSKPAPVFFNTGTFKQPQKETKSSSESLSSVGKNYGIPSTSTADINSEKRHSKPFKDNSSIDSFASAQSTPVVISPKKSGFQSHKSVDNGRLDYCELKAAKAEKFSNSSASIGAASDYVSIDPLKTKAAERATLLTHSTTASQASDLNFFVHKTKGPISALETASLDIPKKGFFRKYRRMRRTQKDAAASTPELHKS